jgi:hypothetical protein
MKKFLIASVVLYIVVVMLGFGIHEGILGNDYRQLMHLFRPQPGSEAYMGYMFLSYLPYVLGVVWIYSMGVQRKPWLGRVCVSASRCGRSPGSIPTWCTSRSNPGRESWSSSRSDSAW